MPRSSRIARYEPEQLLGSTGLVDTYRGRAQDDGRLVALKVLFPDRAEPGVGAECARRFLEAGRQAQAAPVPGMAAVLDVSDDPDSPFLVTEYVPGVDLARLVTLVREPGGTGRPERALDRALASALCAQVAAVLVAAHARQPPLFHLGLCPENVVLCPSGEVKVLDFGLGAALRGIGGSSFDKWHFVAPELIGVDVATLSPSAARNADLYSLGALLHFLVIGQKPVEATSLAELSQGIWEPLSETAGFPRNVRSAVRTLTALDVDERPESAALVVEWLGGDASLQREARARLAALLASFGGELAGDQAPASPPRPGPPRSHATKQPPPRSPGAAAPRPAPRGGTAAQPNVSTPRDRRHLRLTLLLFGPPLAIGLAAWALVSQRPGRQTASAPAGEAPERIAPADPELRRSERAPAPPDGGGRAILATDEAPPLEVYVPEAEQAPARVPKRLFLDTNPGEADVWVDGVLRGKTPVDLMVGAGSHRVVVIKAGYRMLRAVFDTTHGEYARRGLQRAGFPMFGDGLLEVQCKTPDRYPVLLDDEETGFLCPVARIPVPSGKHSVGIFVPSRKASVTIEVTVPPGPRGKRAIFTE